MLIIFGALKIELIHLIRSIHINNIYKTGKTIIYEGFKNSRQVIIIRTGIGVKNAKRAVEYFKDNYSEYAKSGRAEPGNNIEVLMIGFCGATDRNIEAGDTVVYRSIKRIEHSGEKGFLASDILDLNGEKILDSPVSGEYISVTGANVPEVITDPAIKKKLNNDFDIQTIDMESYWIGKVVLEMNLPFTCLRIVSDGAEDTLPIYYESPTNIRMAVNILLSFLRSIFNREEFRSNINAFKNIKKANSGLAKVSAELISRLDQ